MAQPQPNANQNDKEIFNFTPEVIKEIEVALEEVREGNTIPDEQFEEFFCK